MDRLFKKSIPNVLACLLVGAAPVAEAASTMERATTPTMEADQSGCATINYFEVGPGLQYSEIKAVPWSKLKGCDTVRIHARPQPYREMILISAGTNLTPTAPDRFMRVVGVPDDSGALPIIDGANATQLETVPGVGLRSLQYLDINNSDNSRALYKLGLVTVSAQYGRTYNEGPAGYLSIENLEIRNANHGEPFFDGKLSIAQGAPVLSAYRAFTSCLNIETGAHVIVKNNVIHDCGNGLFINSKNGVDEFGNIMMYEISQDILVEGNRFYGNSVATGVGGSGGYSEHNSYSEALGIIFQNNFFGDVKPGAHGDCLKDRSSGLIVRYNRFASNCGVQLHLVDSTGGKDAIYDEPDYATTYVYGNVFDVPPKNETLLTKYGGDSGTAQHYRKGDYFFFNNTFSVSGDANFGAYATVHLFKLSDPAAVVSAFNNVFYTRPTTPGAAGKVIATTIDQGLVNLDRNWFSPNAGKYWLGQTVAGVVNGWESNINTDNVPGFVDAAIGAFEPLASSPLVNRGMLPGQIAAAGHLPRGIAGLDVSRIRHRDGQIDIGAFEFVSPDDILQDSFEP